MKKNVNILTVRMMKQTFYFLKTTPFRRSLMILFMLYFISFADAKETDKKAVLFSLDVKNETVQQVLDKIEEQSEYHFFYNNQQIDLDRFVSIKSNKKGLFSVLDQLFNETNITYFVLDNNIVLSVKDKELKEKKELLFQLKEKRVSGRVTDEFGEAIIGANVVEKEANNGVITDIQGDFSIVVSEQATLQISYIGYLPQEIVVGKQTSFSIILKEDSRALDEVVVVGYGTQKKITLTGAVSAISSEVLTKAPVANMGHALAGNIAGLSSIQYSGQPGSDDPSIYIRGIGSLSERLSKPLILVDGVERSFYRLDPNEIESVSVLKDASSTAVFGVRGANGVILVTTKRGITGKPTISFNSAVCAQHPTRLLKLANSYDYAMLHNEAMRNDGVKEPNLLFKPEIIEAFKNYTDPLLYPNTDWLNVILKPRATQTHHSFNVSGGTNNVRYFASLAVLTQDGLFRSFEKDYNANYVYDRYNYRVNLDIDLSKSTLLKINMGGRQENTKEPNTRDNRTIFIFLGEALPFAGVGLYKDRYIRASHENVPFNRGMLANGDLFASYYGRGYNMRGANTINMDLELGQKLDFILKGLSFNVKGSYNSSYTHKKTRSKGMPYYTAHRNQITGALYYKKFGNRDVFGFKEDMWQDRDWYIEGKLQYDRKIGKHQIHTLLLYNQSRQQYPDPNRFDYPGIPRGYVGYVGRLTYSYDLRYLFDFNIGRNGSENFASGKRYGIFPSISCGWIISEEDFMKKQSLVDYLKIRFSYGIVGNDMMGSKSRFYYLPDAYNVTAGGYNFGTNVSTNLPIAYEKRMGNPFVTWEKARKQNFGIDFSIIDSRLSGSFDVFLERRKDILTTKNTMPSFLSLNLPVVNIGKVDNRGLEAVLKWEDKIGACNYWINGNFSFARNKIIFKDEIPKAYSRLLETGKPVGQQFGLLFDGFVTQEDILKGNMPDHRVELKPGDLKYRDLNGDNVIDDNDRDAIGYPRYPEISYGLTLGCRFKGFDISVLWCGVGNVSAYLGDFLRLPFGSNGQRGLLQHMVDDRWTEETAGSAKFPRLTLNNSRNNFLVGSSFWLRDASYLRLRNLEVGYDINSQFLANKIKVQKFRVYLSGENLLTFDKIKIVDPESIGAYEYPLLKNVNIGLNITF